MFILAVALRRILLFFKGVLPKHDCTPIVQFSKWFHFPPRKRAEENCPCIPLRGQVLAEYLFPSPFPLSYTLSNHVPAVAVDKTFPIYTTLITLPLPMYTETQDDKQLISAGGLERGPPSSSRLSPCTCRPLSYRKKQQNRQSCVERYVSPEQRCPGQHLAVLLVYRIWTICYCIFASIWRLNRAEFFLKKNIMWSIRFLMQFHYVPCFRLVKVPTCPANSAGVACSRYTRECLGTSVAALTGCVAGAPVTHSKFSRVLARSWGRGELV